MTKRARSLLFVGAPLAVAAVTFGALAWQPSVPFRFLSDAEHEGWSALRSRFTGVRAVRHAYVSGLSFRDVAGSASSELLRAGFDGPVWVGDPVAAAKFTRGSVDLVWVEPAGAGSRVYVVSEPNAAERAAAWWREARP